MSHRVPRRQFLKTSLAAGVASLPLLRGSRVLGANERLSVAVIGVGGRGAANVAAVAGENIVALCDVDATRLDNAASQHSGAKKYFDYRELLEQQKNLDAVVIATPDHHHAPATVRALRQGLHVYCEKPLTHTIEEARLITKLAAEKKLATQMGTQNHEHPGYLRTIEWIRAGLIGDVTEVHVITDRPGKFWQQGMEKPTGSEMVPSDLKWDLWLGPAAERDYHAAYVPFKWRGWWDFGCGAVGDMAIHLMDVSFWGLELNGRGPVKVASEGPAPNPDSASKWMHTTFEFGRRDQLPPVTVHWYEGETKAKAEIAAELPMNGSLFIGSKGRIAVEHGQMPKLLPADKYADVKPPEPSLPASPGHHAQWIEACKTGSRTGSSFAYAGPFTEIVLLGNVAYRAGVPIEFDPAQGKVTNHQAANALLSKSYRKGWEL